jgi:uncharacterized membrane protein YgcG
MNKLFTIMTSLAFVLFAGTSFAFTPPPSPAPTSWISDASHVLSPAAHSRLDAKLAFINRNSANELAALIVPSLDGEDISDVTNATFKSWGVGKKGLDNGVLVVLAMKEHKSRIETGKGVEGDLPDLKTQDILNNVLRPHMKKGDVEGALDSTFSAISSSIENHKAEAEVAKTKPVVVTPLPTTSPSCDVSAVGSGTGILGLLVLGFFVVMLLANRSAKKAEAERVRAENERALRRRQEAAEKTRLALEHQAALDKIESERQVAEVKRKLANLGTTPVVHAAPKPVVHVAPKPVHHDAPHPVTHPHKNEPITSVSSAAAIIGAAAIAEREVIAARQRQAERDTENRRAETQRLADRESARRQSERKSAQRREEEAERSRERQREQDSADRARRQREQDDADSRRRDAESSSSYSSSNDSSSSYDSGSSISSYDSGSSSSGSDFGGGDSGGGGSSSDW